MTSGEQLSDASAKSSEVVHQSAKSLHQSGVYPGAQCDSLCKLHRPAAALVRLACVESVMPDLLEECSAASGGPLACACLRWKTHAGVVSIAPDSLLERCWATSGAAQCSGHDVVGETKNNTSPFFPQPSTT